MGGTFERASTDLTAGFKIVVPLLAVARSAVITSAPFGTIVANSSVVFRLDASQSLLRVGLVSRGVSQVGEARVLAVLPKVSGFARTFAIRVLRIALVTVVSGPFVGAVTSP